ncbi:putative iron-regulated membrane protein [Bradyrhizobium sp. LB7.2]
MMSVIVLLHRWLGIAFCLLFAMWFATGIVMHFVPFPSLTEAERFAGLAPVDRAEVRIAVADAVTASGIGDATRVRLIQRSDGPVYIVSAPSRAGAVRASDGGGRVGRVFRHCTGYCARSRSQPRTRCRAGRDCRARGL